MKNIIQLSGNNFEIGEQLGQFWGDYFEEQRTESDQQIIHQYLSWLLTPMPKYYEELYNNTKKYFPDLIEEIRGIAQGTNNSKLTLDKKVTPKQIFMRCLWEEKRSCTSAILKTNDGYLLCHNLEDDPPSGCTEGVFPLCVAKVDLKSDGNQRSFVSVSYPFSLLGAAGLNQHFSFQGNSIGNIGKCKRLSQRIPASVFQRMLLEMTSEIDIKNFLDQYYIPIPGHNYIVFHDRAYSLEIRPCNICDPPNSQYLINSKHNNWHIHTNYFRDNDNKVDTEWLFKSNEALHDWRFEKLIHFFNKRSARNRQVAFPEINNFFKALAQENHKYTSAYILIKVSKKEATCSVHSYFSTINKIQTRLT